MKEVNLVNMKYSTEYINLTLEELIKTHYGVLLTMNKHKCRTIVHQFGNGLYQFISWTQHQAGYSTNRIDDESFSNLHNELCKHKIFVFYNEKELFEWFTGEEE